MQADNVGLLLVVGDDSVLLRTRAAVLRATGFRVIEAQGGHQAKMAAGYFTFAAAVLCHTLHPNERDALAYHLGNYAKYAMPIMKLKAQECLPVELIVAVQALVNEYKATYPVRARKPSYELVQARPFILRCHLV